MGNRFMCRDNEMIAIRLRWLNHLSYEPTGKEQAQVINSKVVLSSLSITLTYPQYPAYHSILSFFSPSCKQSIQFNSILESTIIMSKVISKPLGCSLNIRSIRTGNIKGFRSTIGFCNHFEFNWFSILIKIDVV